jgi:primosomal replication protein N
LSESNRLILTGRVVELEALRYTPAGVAIVRFKLAHDSEQSEAGEIRQLHMEIACVATETMARLVCAAPLGSPVRVEGFIAHRSKNHRGIELHADNIQFE